MEVIVDDSQLSLAIGKKGQNVRLAAKLLGWKIDIKSEEEKRQEVESQMAALVVPGAPVTVLMDHGLSEKLVERLAEAGVPTVERLGAMTPEQLEEIPGIGPKMIEKIQSAVVNYYGQFEVAVEAEGQQASPAEAVAGEAAEEIEESQEKGGEAVAGEHVETSLEEAPLAESDLDAEDLDKVVETDEAVAEAETAEEFVEDDGELPVSDEASEENESDTIKETDLAS